MAEFDKIIQKCDVALHVAINTINTEPKSRI